MKADPVLKMLDRSLFRFGWVVLVVAGAGCATGRPPAAVVPDVGSPAVFQKPRLDLNQSEPFHFTRAQLSGPPIDDLAIVICGLSERGLLTGCKVVKPSPHVFEAQLLDFCHDLVFEPARDAQGHPLAIRRYTVPIRVCTMHGP